jgi:3-carboxy-cis,cis-muconate cycloisomerase
MAIGTVPVILSAMVQEQERAVGGWQAEWEAMPNLFRFTACTVKSVRSAITGLHIDPEQMRANLALHGGLNMAEALMMALAPHIGRPEAYRLVQAISKRTQEMRHALHATALADEQIRAILSPEEIHRALDPTMYTGSSNMFIDRALASFHTIQSACT